MATTTPELGLGPLGKLLLLVKVSRVPGWCFGPILYTIGLINAHAIPRTVPELLCTGLTLFALSFPLCIIIFGVNDVYDYESDLRNPRKQTSAGLEGGVLAPAHHPFVLFSARIASHFIIAANTITAPPIITPDKPEASIKQFFRPERVQVAVVTLLIVSLGYAYSSPPLRLKERPLLDALSNGCIVWLCWALGYASSELPLPIFSAVLPFHKPLDENAHKGWLLALCTSGVHAMGAVADVKADLSAGQRTIATTFGERLASAFAVVMYMLAFTTTESESFVGMYTLIGAAIALFPTIKPTPIITHGAFQAIVYASVLGAAGWIGGKAFATVKYS